MSEQDAIISLLTEIRDNQREALQHQEQQLAIARAQMERSQGQVEESIRLQRQAVERFRKVSFIAVPGIALCIVLILYLVLRYF